MQLELLESFDIPSVRIPPRSRLVSLDPQGMNSTYCESLLSYLTRLAGAHVLRPNVMVKEIILPLTGINLDTSSCGFNQFDSRTINSYTKYARTFSQAIESLTLQKNLRDLTFLPWGDLLDRKGSRLLRDHVGFCPECLDEWEKSASIIYYPMIWYLRAARLCSRHKCLLQECCFSCGKHQKFVAYHAMLGYCTHCGAWLGTPNTGRAAPVGMPEITDRDKFMTEALEQMIANNSNVIQFASHERFGERLKLYCQALTKGNMKRFEIRLGFKKNVVASWADKCRRPQIDMFLELCFRLGHMPVQLLTADIPSNLSDLIGQFDIAHSTKKVRLSQEQLSEMRDQLQTILEGPVPHSQKAITSLLGVTLGFLNYYFPVLTRAIADKRKQLVAIRTKERQAAKIARAKAVIERMFDERRSISRRKMWAELENEGLTFADPKMRHAVREVIEGHLCQETISTEKQDGQSLA